MAGAPWKTLLHLSPPTFRVTYFSHIGRLPSINLALSIHFSISFWLCRAQKGEASPTSHTAIPQKCSLWLACSSLNPVFHILGPTICFSTAVSSITMGGSMVVTYALGLSPHFEASNSTAGLQLSICGARDAKLFSSRRKRSFSMPKSPTCITYARVATTATFCAMLTGRIIKRYV